MHRNVEVYKYEYRQEESKKLKSYATQVMSQC